MSWSHLTRAATHLEAQFPDECEIREPDTLGALNTTTGVYDSPVQGALVYSGPCMLSQPPHMAGTIDTAGQDRQHESHRLRIPISATEPDLGDVVTITASERDSAMVGMTLEVTGPRSYSYSVSKIIGCRSVERSPVVT